MAERRPPRSGSRPPARRGDRPSAGRPEVRPPVDKPRRVAYDLLRAVADDGAYANLLLPRLIDRAGLHGRDAALATELGYGAVRAAGTLDEILQLCVDRPVAGLDPPVLDLLLPRLIDRAGLHGRDAALATTVDLARTVGQARASGLVNAVLRRISRDTWDGWLDSLDGPPIRQIALHNAHPEWIAVAFANSLGEPLEGDLTETAEALAADDERPVTHLVAWPGVGDPDELPGEPGRWSPYARVIDGGDPGEIAAVRDHRAGVQDEGSQLVALALADAPVDGRDERWLDLCAGPGGKAVLLAALAAQRGAHLRANELREHRAELVRQAVGRFDVEVTVGDARDLPEIDGGYDRILLDAPCTGLGALRRRPEARWRRTPGSVGELTALQTSLLAAALRLVRPGGVVVYATCSPHLAETVDVVQGALDTGSVQLIEDVFGGVPDTGARLGAQLWPHRHGTDAMYCALLRRL